MSGNRFESPYINVSDNHNSSPRNSLHPTAGVEDVDVEIEVEDSYKLANQPRIPEHNIHFLSSQDQIDIVYQTPQSSAAPATPPLTVKSGVLSKRSVKTKAGEKSIATTMSGPFKAQKPALKANVAANVRTSQTQKLNPASEQSSSGKLQKLNIYGLPREKASSSQAKEAVKQNSKRKPEATRQIGSDDFDIPVEHEEASAPKKRGPGRPKKNESTTIKSSKPLQHSTGMPSKRNKVESQASKEKNKSRSKPKQLDEDPDDDFVGPTKATTKATPAQKTVTTRITRSKHATNTSEPVRLRKQSQTQAQQDPEAIQKSTSRTKGHKQYRPGSENHEHESLSDFEDDVVQYPEDDLETQQEPSQFSLPARLDAAHARHGPRPNILAGADETFNEELVSERSRRMPPPKLLPVKTTSAVKSSSSPRRQQPTTIPAADVEIAPSHKNRKESLVPFDASGPRIQGTFGIENSSFETHVQPALPTADPKEHNQVAIVISNHQPQNNLTAIEISTSSVLQQMLPRSDHRKEPRNEGQSRPANMFKGEVQNMQDVYDEEPDSPLSANTEKTSPDASKPTGQIQDEPLKTQTGIEANVVRSIARLESTSVAGQGPLPLLETRMQERGQAKAGDHDEGPAESTSATNDLADLTGSTHGHLKIPNRAASNGSQLPAEHVACESVEAPIIANVQGNGVFAVQETQKVHLGVGVSPNKSKVAGFPPTDIPDSPSNVIELARIGFAQEHHHEPEKRPDQLATHTEIANDENFIRAKQAMNKEQALILALKPTQIIRDQSEVAETPMMKTTRVFETPETEAIRKANLSKAHEDAQMADDSPERPVAAANDQTTKQARTKNLMALMRNESPEHQMSILGVNTSIVGQEYGGDAEEEDAEEEEEEDLQMRDDYDPDRTLVNEDEPDEQYHNEESSGSETSECLDSESDAMLSPSQEMTAVRDEWRAALESHQESLFNSLVEISHQLIRNLVDKETAIKDILSDYRGDGLNLIEHLGTDQARAVKEYQLQVLQADAQLRFDLQEPRDKLGKYMRLLKQSRTQVSKRDMTAVSQRLKAFMN